MKKRIQLRKKTGKISTQSLPAILTPALQMTHRSVSGARATSRGRMRCFPLSLRALTHRAGISPEHTKRSPEAEAAARESLQL